MWVYMATRTKNKAEADVGIHGNKDEEPGCMYDRLCVSKSYDFIGPNVVKVDTKVRNADDKGDNPSQSDAAYDCSCRDVALVQEGLCDEQPALQRDQEEVSVTAIELHLPDEEGGSIKCIPSK
jgi:hypothetical protein